MEVPNNAFAFMFPTFNAAAPFLQVLMFTVAVGASRWLVFVCAVGCFQDAEGTYKTYIGAGALPPDGFTNPADPRVQEELTDRLGVAGSCNADCLKRIWYASMLYL